MCACVHVCVRTPVRKLRQQQQQLLHLHVEGKKGWMEGQEKEGGKEGEKEWEEGKKEERGERRREAGQALLSGDAAVGQMLGLHSIEGGPSRGCIDDHDPQQECGWGCP